MIGLIPDADQVSSHTISIRARPVPEICRKITTSALIWLVLLLSACATRPPVPDIDTNARWRLRQQQLNQITDWQLAGRISVQLASEGWSASLYWQQDNEDYKLRIVAPLGRGTVEISGNADTVRLRTVDNQILEDKDVALLMQQNLGWEIPVAALIYWIRGLPEPGTADSAINLDPLGQLAGISQAGWNVSYEKYTRVGTLDLPARMTVQREQLKLRLSINKWTLPDES